MTMKRMLSRMLMLALCLCMAAPAALAANVTVLPRTEEYRSGISLVSVGNTVYILTAEDIELELYAWREGMSEAEVVAQGILYAGRFSSREEAAGMMETYAYAYDLTHALSFLFSDGEQLCGYNGLDNTVFTIQVTADGLSYGDAVALPEVDRSSYITPVSAVHTGQWLLWCETDQKSRSYTQRLLAYNLERGTVKQAVLPQIYDVASYKDGMALVLCAADEEQLARGNYAVYVYDPATDAAECIGLLPKGINVRRIEYSPELDMLIYQDQTRIMGWTAEAGAQQIGYVPTASFVEMAVTDGQLAYTSDDVMVSASELRAGYATEHSLTLMGGTMHSVLGYFTKRFQDVPVYYMDKQADETYQQILSRKQNSPDLLFLYEHEGAFTALAESGALMDLSGFEEIKAYTDVLYPAFKEYVTRGDAIYAVPIMGSSYTGWFINKEVMNAMGLTQEDIPTNLVELCVFATRWNNEYAEKYPNYTLLNNTTGYRERILEAMLENWSWYCQQQGKALKYDDPVFRELLAALDNAELKKLDEALKQTDPEVSEYKQALIWTGCKVVGNWGTYMEEYSDRIFIPLTLTAETPYVAPVQNISLWMVNANSENAEYAAAILGEVIANQDEKAAYTLRTDKVDAVINEGFAEIQTYEAERLAELEARLEESINRATIEKRIEQQKEYMAGEMLRSKYAIAPSTIAHYQDVIAPASFVYTPDAVDVNGRSEEVYGCIKRYVGGTMEAEKFIEMMDDLLSAAQ